MSEYESQIEAQNDQILTPKEREILMLKADYRRYLAKYKMDLYKIPRPQDESSRIEFDKKRLKIEKNLDIAQISSEDATILLIKGEESLRKKAVGFSESLPRYSAYLYANLAKLRFFAGEKYHNDFKNADELISKSSKVEKLDDLLAEAVIVGLLKTNLGNRQIPPVDRLVQAAASDQKMIADIALSLDDKEQKNFLQQIPEKIRDKMSLLMDRELSKVLKQSIATEEEKEQIKQMQGETAQKLEKLLGVGERETVKLLVEILGELETDQTKLMFKKFGKESLKKDTSSVVDSLRRIIVELAKYDEFASGSLVMKLLGKKELKDSYFTYFTQKLIDKGFLTNNLYQAESWPDTRCQELFDYLTNSIPQWQDEENVIKPFKEGVRIFGWQKMFGYAGRSDVTPHDALFAFSRIIDLMNLSGLSATQFYGQILSQVKMDSSSYEAGTSYHALNEIANSINVAPNNLERMRAKINKYPQIDRLKDLAVYFDSNANIFNSWTNLKKFSELIQLLERAEILDELNELKNEAKNDYKKQKLYQFIEYLAFHPDSKVNMQMVLQFWREPEKFLELADEHTPSEVQDAKKPSNYTDIPHLDLTAEELRDALVGGELDRIQTFLPMEIVYSVENTQELQVELSFLDKLKQEIGSKKDGTANGKLFKEVSKILGSHKINIIDYLQSGGQAATGTDLREIEIKINEAMAQYPNDKIKQEQKPIAKRYRAKVNLKSDPQAVLAGNDTACCMFFGSGKNNIYMFNPNCALFTLEEQRGNAWKTIAQSVLTADKDIKKPIPEVVKVLQENTGNLSGVLPESVLSETKYLLSCDNIEVATNAKDKAKIIEAIYRSFFEKYLPYLNAQADCQYNEDKIIIGQGNSDIRFGVEEPNTFAPVAPVGYSDKLGAKVDAVYFKSHGREIKLKEEEVKQEDTERAGIRLSKGISPLNFQDSLAVGFLESKAYSDNDKLITQLHNMENGLIAKDINNENKKRPNLSFKYIDEIGKIRGYILAYEGRDDDGKPMIYIADLASDKESKMAGGRLINQFLDFYKREYLAKGRLIPIYMQARENTSYKILQGSLTSIEKKLDIKVKVDEERAYPQNDDIMHPLWLRPIR